MYAHQKLKVHQLSIHFSDLVRKLLSILPSGNSDLCDHLRRAALSISLNIAEGAAKTGAKDKRRFYSIARGSALECAAVLEVIEVWKLVDRSSLSELDRDLEQIAAMLGALCRK